jgi:hypothetical protein
MKVGRYGAMLIAALLLGEMCITPKLDSFAAQEKTDICEDISEESDIVTEVNSAEALNDMLADSWYEDISGADSIDEEESFALKRLILYADSLYDTYGAENILCYDEYDEYILEFDSEEETEAAYYEIGRDYGFDNCFPDQLIDCDNMYSYEELYPYTTSDELDNLEVGSYDWII